MTNLSRPAVISLGITAMLAGVVLGPGLLIVVVLVTTWWLADDLRRDPSTRPGWLGTAAFAVFTLVAVASAAVVTIFDTHFDCGGTLGGFGEAADARLDQACADAGRWRSVVAVTLALVVCGVGYVGVRRSDESQSPLLVAARTIDVVALAVTGIVAVLVVT